MKKLLALFVLLFATQAFASQNSTVLPTTSPYAGLTMLNNINSAFDTFRSNFSGATAPSSVTSYQWWVDSSTSLLKFYDGSAWLPVAKYSGSQWVSISNGVIGTIPASTGSANAYVVTYSPVPTALVTGQHYPFIANFQNTSAATLNVNSLGAKAITKRGAVALASADIVSGAIVDTVYDGTQFQMVSQLGNAASGTVTSVATSGGVTGGPITASGTISLTSQSNNTILSNISGSSAEPTGNTVTAVIDTIGGTQGQILYRGASAWTALSAGTNGQILTTQGAGANPVWATAAPSGVASYQIFTSSGTWTKPSGVTANSVTFIEAWGGGGGATYGGTTGAGGGGYRSRLILTSLLGATETVTVGAGGSGSAGGNSSFGTFITAYGGSATSGGGGFSNGGGQTNTFWDGGDSGSTGGSSYYGGGGGANRGGTAGVSVFGGSGGSTNNAGSIPGGGGGSSSGAPNPGGAGGRGEVRVTVWY